MAGNCLRSNFRQQAPNCRRSDAFDRQFTDEFIAVLQHMATVLLFLTFAMPVLTTLWHRLALFICHDDAATSNVTAIAVPDGLQGEGVCKNLPTTRQDLAVY